MIVYELLVIIINIILNYIQYNIETSTMLDYLYWLPW